MADLTENQFAQKIGALEIDNAKTSIKFSKADELGNVTLTFKVTFKPDQVSPGPVMPAIIAATHGVFNFGDEQYGKHSDMPAFSILPNDTKILLSADGGNYITDGKKVDHAAT